MKVRVNTNVCNGTGLCAGSCPEVFELSDESVAMVKMDEVPAEFQQRCKEAADNCPTAAISIEE